MAAKVKLAELFPALHETVWLSASRVQLSGTVKLVAL